LDGSYQQKGQREGSEEQATPQQLPPPRAITLRGRSEQLEQDVGQQGIGGVNKNLGVQRGLEGQDGTSEKRIEQLPIGQGQMGTEEGPGQPGQSTYQAGVTGSHVGQQLPAEHEAQGSDEGSRN